MLIGKSCRNVNRILRPFSRLNQAFFRNLCDVETLDLSADSYSKTKLCRKMVSEDVEEMLRILEGGLILKGDRLSLLRFLCIFNQNKNFIAEMSNESLADEKSTFIAWK